MRAGDIKQKLKAQNYLLVIMEKGYGKRTKLSEYRLQRRGGSGIKTARITAKTGSIVFIEVLTEEEKDLMAISQKGQVIRASINSISILSRVTSGVKIMKLEQGDKIVGAVCL